MNSFHINPTTNVSSSGISHDDKNIPICRVCNMKFASFPELKEHIRQENHHDATASNAMVGKIEKSLVCRICSQKFPNILELKDHIRKENHYDISSTLLPAAAPTSKFAPPNTNSSASYSSPMLQSKGPTSVDVFNPLAKESKLRQQLLQKNIKPYVPSAPSPPPTRSFGMSSAPPDTSDDSNISSFSLPSKSILKTAPLQTQSWSSSDTNSLKPFDSNGLSANSFGVSLQDKSVQFNLTDSSAQSKNPFSSSKPFSSNGQPISGTKSTTTFGGFSKPTFGQSSFASSAASSTNFFEMQNFPSKAPNQGLSSSSSSAFFPSMTTSLNYSSLQTNSTGNSPSASPFVKFNAINSPNILPAIQEGSNENNGGEDDEYYQDSSSGFPVQYMSEDADDPDREDGEKANFGHVKVARSRHENVNYSPKSMAPSITPALSSDSLVGINVLDRLNPTTTGEPITSVSQHSSINSAQPSFPTSFNPFRGGSSFDDSNSGGNFKSFRNSSLVLHPSSSKSNAAVGINSSTATRSTTEFPVNPLMPTSSNVYDSIGTCEDMCPEEERTKREREFDLHAFEKLENQSVFFRPAGHPINLSHTMIKRFQRSSADHELRIPHLLRTPSTLYRTICFIESQIMDGMIGETPESMIRYLFIWDRFRMIAKDFILQSSSLEKSAVWIECHERMARWYVLMDHRMKANEEYLGGHAQQNLESLNNILKTLDSYYKNPTFLASPESTVLLRNQGEFYSYFILVQLGNTDVITKFLQSIPVAALNSNEVKLALKVAGVIKRGEFAQFFKLMRSATPLQACLMHTYTRDIRVSAIISLARSCYKDTYYPLKHLVSLLMFEDIDECMSFCQQFGIDFEWGEEDEGLCAVIWNAANNGSRILNSLPLDKNGIPVKPVALHMRRGIESRFDGLTTSQICVNNGVSNSVLAALVKPTTPRSQKWLDRGPASAEIKVKSEIIESSLSYSTVSSPCTNETFTTTNALSSSGLAFNLGKNLGTLPDLPELPQNDKSTLHSTALSFQSSFQAPPASASSFNPFLTKPVGANNFNTFQSTSASSDFTASLFPALTDPAGTSLSGILPPTGPLKKTTSLVETQSDVFLNSWKSSLKTPSLQISQSQYFHVPEPPSTSSPSFNFGYKHLTPPISGDKLKQQNDYSATVLEPENVKTVFLDAEAEAELIRVKEAEQNRLRLAELTRVEAIQRQEVEQQERELEEERLRKQAVEQERVRLAETERLRKEALELELMRENERLLEIERQRVEEQQKAKELLSRRRDRISIAKQICIQITTQRLMKTLLSLWKVAYQQSVQQQRIIYTSIFLKIWRRIFIKQLERHVKMIETIRSINITKNENNRQFLYQIQRIKQRLIQFKKRTECDKRKSSSGKPLIEIMDEKYNRSCAVFLLSDMRSRLGHQFDILAHLVSPAKTSGSILLHKQTNHLYRTFGQQSTNSKDQPHSGSNIFHWPGQLYFKLCIISLSSSSGMWDDTDSFGCNLIRSCLTSTNSFGLTANLSISSFSEIVEYEKQDCVANMNIFDIGMDTFTVSTTKKEVFDVVAGSQTIILLLPSNLLNLCNTSESYLGRLRSFLDYMKTVLEHEIAISVVVVDERPLINSATPSVHWAEVSMEEIHFGDCSGESVDKELVSNTVRMLEKLVADERILHSINVAFVFHYSYPSNKHPSSSSDHLEGYALGTYQGIQDVLIKSATICDPQPLIQHLNIVDWLEEQILQKLRDDSMSIQNLCGVVNATLSICKQRIMTNMSEVSSNTILSSFPSPTFARPDGRIPAASIAIGSDKAESFHCHDLPLTWSDRETYLEALNVLDKFHIPYQAYSASGINDLMGMLKDIGWEISSTFSSKFASQEQFCNIIRNRARQLSETLDPAKSSVYLLLTPQYCAQHKQAPVPATEYTTPPSFTSSLEPRRTLEWPVTGTSIYENRLRLNKFEESKASGVSQQELLVSANLSMQGETDASSSSCSLPISAPLQSLIAFNDNKMTPTKILDSAKSTLNDSIADEIVAQDKLEKLLSTALLSELQVNLSSELPPYVPNAHMYLKNTPVLSVKSKRDLTYVYEGTIPDDSSSDARENGGNSSSSRDQFPLATDLSQVKEFLKRCRKERENFDLQYA